MKIAMVGRDAAQSRAFTRLKPVLIGRGYKVNLMVGDGQPLSQSDNEIVSAVQDSDVVLLGMSSAPETAQPEILAGLKAHELGKPCVFYGDVVKCWMRARSGAWFEELAKTAAMYLGVNEIDAEAAREVFPVAILVATGNPLREDIFFSEMTREQVRSELKVSENEILVLAPGGKYDGWGDIAFWNTIMEALMILSGKGMRFKLIMTPHPGDRILRLIDPKAREGSKAVDVYGDMARLSGVPAEVVLKARLSTSQIVPGSDVIVDFASSTNVEGACQRKPVITLGIEILWRCLEAANGTRYLEWVDKQTSELVPGYPEKLAEAIKRLLTPEGYAPQLARQEKHYPVPERGLVLREMANAICYLLPPKN